jgi:hypothetical protein
MSSGFESRLPLHVFIELEIIGLGRFIFLIGITPARHVRNLLFIKDLRLRLVTHQAGTQSATAASNVMNFLPKPG